jgi:hypothetical protein
VEFRTVEITGNKVNGTLLPLSGTVVVLGQVSLATIASGVR